MVSPFEAPKIAKYFADALLNDFFVPFIITSQTQAKNKSVNLPFGLGKTSLAFWISYVMHGEDLESTKNHFFFYPSKLFRACMPSVPRKPKIPCPIYDDVQATAPKSNTVSTIIQRMAGYVSTERPEIATFCMTANNINAIAAPLRSLPVFELIVYERGKYEVQQILYHKNFKNPSADLSKLEYRGEGTFEAMPPIVQKWYDDWRATQKIPQAQKLITDLENYERKELPKQLSPNEQEASEAGKALVSKRWGRKIEPLPIPQAR